MKTRRALIKDLRVKWFDHEDAFLLSKNIRLQFATYASLKTLYERIPGYNVGELIDIKKWIGSHRGYKSA